MSTKTIPEILDGAADYIEEHGWCQGVYYAYDGDTPPACASGAIRHVVYGKRFEDYDEGDLRYELVVEARDALIDYLGVGISVWNDEPERTARGVIIALRAAARSVREGESR